MNAARHSWRNLSENPFTEFTEFTECGEEDEKEDRVLHQSDSSVEEWAAVLKIKVHTQHWQHD